MKLLFTQFHCSLLLSPSLLLVPLLTPPPQTPQLPVFTQHSLYSSCTVREKFHGNRQLFPGCYSLLFRQEIKLKLSLCILFNGMAYSYCRYRTTLDVYLLHSFSTLTLDRVEWSASKPERFTLAEGAIGAIEQEVRWAPGLVRRIWRLCRKL